jgi:hypothetical protein
LNYFFENNFKTIVELGTSRSFVDGKFPGCNEDDVKYWEPENPEKWDWSAGIFTKVFSFERLTQTKCSYSLGIKIIKLASISKK